MIDLEYYCKNGYVLKQELIPPDRCNCYSGVNGDETYKSCTLCINIGIEEDE